MLPHVNVIFITRHLKAHALLRAADGRVCLTISVIVITIVVLVYVEYIIKCEFEHIVQHTRY